MSETTPEPTAVLGRRGDAECERVRTSLADGRHAEALAAVRRARRLRPAQEAPELALAEADALFGLLRYRDAVVVATRALRRGSDQDDVEARLRVVRGHGLWLTGPASRAHGELRKAARQATAPLTRARVLEEQALHASKTHDREAALAHLAHAEQIYVTTACASGLSRVLEKRATVLRDAGRLEEALRVHEQRIEMAAGIRALGHPGPGAQRPRQPPGRARALGGGPPGVRRGGGAVPREGRRARVHRGRSGPGGGRRGHR